MSKRNEYTAQIERILEKLKLVQGQKPSCYGSDFHGFKLRAPLTEAEVEKFEAAQGVQLPEDYRLFLTHVGNGGAGPYNGIIPLNEWDNFAEWVVDDRPETFLTLPCPLHPGMPRTEDWEEQLRNAKPFEVSPYQGTLSLGSQGCAFAMQLIVSGPHRGRVVYVDADDSPPYIVHEPNFLSWYERWLDELLQGYNFSWFGYGPGGGEHDFFSILRNPEASDEFRAEAARAFCRLPGLPDSGAARIAAYLDDPLAGVRAGAVATIRYFHLTNFVDQVGQRLEDSSADVRKEAVTTVIKLDAWRFFNAVLRRLHEDPDEDVASSAFHALKGTEVLTKAELVRIVEDPKRRGLRSLAADAMESIIEDVPFLLRLLGDSDKYVRSRAMMSLKQVQGQDSLPHLLDLLSHEQDVHLVGHILKALGEFGEPSTVPVLLKWARSADDFHRLDAMEALAKIGDERAVEPALAMLQEERKPERRNHVSLSSMTHIKTIGELVRQSLQDSPNPVLRQLAK